MMRMACGPFPLPKRDGSLVSLRHPVRPGRSWSPLHPCGRSAVEVPHQPEIRPPTEPGTAGRALPLFVTSSPWGAAHVRARLARRMESVIKPTALVIDDSGFFKGAGASPGVSRCPRSFADGGYGDTAVFRIGLEGHGLTYMVGISTTTTAQPEDAQLCAAAHAGRGRPLVPAYPEPAHGVKSLVIAAGKSSASACIRTSWPCGSGPPDARSARPRPAPSCRGAGCWPNGSPTKTSSCSSGDCREMNQALGLAHCEGGTWPGWHHHVTLISVAHAFCTLQSLTRSPQETASA
ncbi:transposase [Streptomyces lavendulae]|uniref:transposase n=1 Tax=Streptomyces lavendulae TaxID=1914 RepID=UPI0036BACF1F